MRILPLFALFAGCTANAFACEEANDCAGVMGGVCEATGWCSFPDDGCESGRRYGEWAGDELAGACVDDVGTGSSSAADDEATSASDPTSLATTDPDTTLDGPDTTMSIDPDTTTTDPTSPGDESSTTGASLDPDLVAWYRFDEGEFAGGVVDEIGMHDGTCLLDLCPQPIPGVVGSAAQFDGIDDIVRVPVTDMLVVGDALTVALWMRVDTIDGMFQTVAAKAYLDLIDDTWEIGINGSGVMRWGLSTEDPVHPNVNADAPPVGEWIHVAGTFDGEAARMYVDGVLVGEAVGGVIAQDEHDVTLGAGFDNGADANWLEGALDEVRIYRRALTPDEIAALASR
jgi:hypothetical protein